MNTELENLKQEFLETWPLERVENMTLDEYTNLNKEDSFCYWIESKTSDLGSIWGGSSYKFGIYRRNDTSKSIDVDYRKSDNIYAWFTKYGDTKDEAFINVKKHILTIINSVINNNISAIDAIDLGFAYKWKIAFLYGDYNSLNIFKEEALKAIANHLNIRFTKNTDISSLHNSILEKKEPNQNYFNFTKELWQIASLNIEGIKEEFSDWLTKSQTSNKVGSYLRAMDILNEILEIDLFLEKDIDKLELLYEDLIKEQKNINGKYYYEQAPSYGNNGFYSASLKAFIAFLNDKSIIENQNSIENLVSEFITYLQGYADFTIKVYSENFKLYLQSYMNDNGKKFLDKDDFIFLSNVTFSNYQSKTYQTYEHKGKGHVHFIEFFESKIINIEEKILGRSSNKILYGPPGTGKTYATKKLAVELIEDCLYTDAKETRKHIIENYNELYKNGQIAFITFHQSMSYEDFVEGIKPKTEESQVTYEIEDGIFKRLVTEASYSIAQEVKQDSISKTLDFSALYDSYLDTISEKLENEDNVPLQTKSGGNVYIVDISPQGNFLLAHKNGTRRYTVSKDRLLKLNEGIPNLTAVSNVHNEFRNVIGGSNASVYWAVLNQLQQLNNQSKITLKEKIISYQEKADIVNSLVENDYKKGNGKPHVLIIDEVNRGNVSAIFGELITLLEPDKRLGQSEAITVKLPYSKTKFGVPHNLHIIGTMNTADRSVEALDTALRRRFEFTELIPKPELLEEIIFIEDELTFNLKEVLETINNRIEVLIDRDHTIGHSYFINIEGGDTGALANTFNNKVIPLLQEYFFGDYGKIGLVLGNGFVEQKNNGNIKFAKFSYQNQEDFKKNSFLLKKNTSESILEAISETLGMTKEKQEKEQKETRTEAVEIL